MFFVEAHMTFVGEYGNYVLQQLKIVKRTLLNNFKSLRNLVEVTISNMIKLDTFEQFVYTFEFFAFACF